MKTVLLALSTLLAAPPITNIPLTGAPVPITQVYVSVCGASIQGSSGDVSGGVVTGESRVCELLRVAAAFEALGQHEEALELVEVARDLVDPQATFAQRAAWVVRQWCLDPLFSLIPWVGTAAY